MRLARRVLLPLSSMLVVTGLASAQQTNVEVIPVLNRPAEDLVPVLSAMVGADGSVTSMNDKLVVRATPAVLAQVRSALAGLDVAPRAVTITVRQGGSRTDQERSAGVAGHVSTGGGGRVVVTGAFAQGGSSTATADVQMVRALDGRPAFISIGRAEPVPWALVLPRGDRLPIASGTSYQAAEVGFWVTPRLAGDTVTLEIATRAERFQGGGLEGTRARTTVSGRLGTWVVLGQVTADGATSGAGGLSTASARSSDRRTIEVKVEEVR